MLKPEIKFERFLEIVLPGAIVSISLWYLHRPFLLVYFPTVAKDSSILTGEQSTVAAKALVFLFMSVLIGLVIRNLSDIIVASLFDDESGTEKAGRKIRTTVRFIMRILLFTQPRDPRVYSINRYLLSPRREIFLKMVQSWCGTSEELLKKKEEAVVVHQHLVTRLKVLSADSRTVLIESFNPVTILASILFSILVVLVLGALSFYTEEIVQAKVPVQPNYVLVSILLTFYFSAIVIAYILQRTMRHFSSQVVTLALHYYMKENREK